MILKLYDLIKFFFICIFVINISISYSGDNHNPSTVLDSAGISSSIKLPSKEIFFRINVVDEETGRGVPLVKFKTLTSKEYFSDSAGNIAFFEPALMDKDVYFYIESHGYSYPKDMFGNAGIKLKTTPGKEATVKIKRENIAKRLYRITGTGIYQDTILLGLEPPVKHGLSNANVLGQDSANSAIYHGRVFCLWGDTTNMKYPLAANFKTTAGFIDLPEKSGLDPELGININYFEEKDFVKPLMPVPGSNPYWLGAVVTVKDKDGKEHLIAHYSKIKPPMDTEARGICEFNDEKTEFIHLQDRKLDDKIQPNGQPFRYQENGENYIYFFQGQLCRVKDNYESVINAVEYEAYTCFKDGAKFDKDNLPKIDRDKDGKAKFSWKKDTSPAGPNEMKALCDKGKMKPEEKWFRMIDSKTGKEINYHAGSIQYNEFRKRWILIATEMWGSSLLGEIWYAEADAPTGPWTYAEKIITHNTYTMYNPLQHPYFAKENGRKIFFEGTYSELFSGTKNITPQYDYNQMMYEVDTDYKRLIQPNAVYFFENEYPQYRTAKSLAAAPDPAKIAFYAPDIERAGTIPIYEIKKEGKKGTHLSLTPSDAARTDEKSTLVFYALRLDDDSCTSATTPLYETNSDIDDIYVYKTEIRTGLFAGYKVNPLPICRVWKNPNMKK